MMTARVRSWPGIITSRLRSAGLSWFFSQPPIQRIVEIGLPVERQRPGQRLALQLGGGDLLVVIVSR